MTTQTKLKECELPISHEALMELETFGAITTVGELIDTSEAELADIRYISINSLKHIINARKKLIKILKL